MSPSTRQNTIRRIPLIAVSPVLTVALVAGTVTVPAHAQAAGSSALTEAVGEYLPAILPAVQHHGAPVPEPLSLSDYGWYISDLSSYDGGIYYDVVSSFSDLRDNHPEVMKDSLDTVVDVNNSADPETVRRAQVDAAADDGNLLTALSDAFGSTLGEALRTSLQEHRLPKTRTLMDSGYLSRAGGLASSTLIEKEIFNYDRPFVVAPDRITKHTGGGNEGLYDLSGSAAFPSGHTNQASWTTTLLAVLLPELAPQLLARGAEAGYNRMVMGVHYPLDVVGGRMTGQAAAADRWNDPKMRTVLTQAGQELRAELEWRTGMPLAEAVATDTPYRSTGVAVGEYTSRMTHGLRRVGDPEAPLTVPQGAPELLVTAFPDLSWGQRARVLAATALPAGYPLDDQSPKGRAVGSWQRMNLAAAFAADVEVGQGAALMVNGRPA
ncbi:Putative phosphatase [Corynebacterium glyciniphilum AJ 3170]|uniref:Putative phosphatase n=1 Tax=Corynebacterium glyciniphilum AJ 3170 TaxID=1404245 RepID=X5DQ40_9CORY|nr:phosphatase PAP2 family protein [Corynebacterium glyciniphilum]AHW63399.1 Putative phosphatase [Corynebacterium glyciniphilum AJ 3170]